MITRYDYATAPSPRRARILLAEKGIAHQTVQIDLKAGEQRLFFSHFLAHGFQHQQKRVFK